jgi:hypothetical protein
MMPGGNNMDEIEAGFEKIRQMIEETREKEKTLSETVRQHEAELLGRMAVSAIPVVKSVGINLLKIGKQGTKNDIYDANYYLEKMIVLGKAEQPKKSRPDDPLKAVTDQFIVLSEKGKFFELMYSTDGFITDSFINPIDPKNAFDTYGYDVVLMLYRAMRDYLKSEEELVSALEKVLTYIHGKKKKP